MHYPDLSAYRYLLKDGLSTVRNVGWLEAGHSIAFGRTDADFIAKLEAVILSRSPADFHVNRLRGAHPCALSPACPALMRVGLGADSYLLGSSELWIPSPSGRHYYAAPSMVLHYARDHAYLPPSAFIAAILALDLARPFIAQDLYHQEVAGHF